MITTATTITTFFNGKSQKYESVPGAYCPTGMTTGSGVPKIVKPGYYTVGGEHLTNKTRFAQRICPVGHYCTDGRRIRCPAGRYGGSEGLPNISCTNQCDAGYFCPQGSWNKDYGIRIDHFLINSHASDKVKNCKIDKALRGKEKPSDHAPIIIEF